MTKNRNWTQYNESLVNRGNITFWFSDDVLKLWNHKNQGYRRGRPFVYSDTAIETLLIVREVFHLTYRSAEGFGRNMFSLLKVQEARVPDYTSLCKRSKTLNVSLKVHGKRGSLDVVVDSTGLKVYGEGEWKVYKHGRSKRRTWRKLHIAIDAKTQQIVAAEMTSNSRDDASVVPDLLTHIDGNVVSLRGDGAYDKRSVYHTTSRLGILPVIPPRKNARYDQKGDWGSNGIHRNGAILISRLFGSNTWKEQVNYHQRSLVETAMFRIKKLFGERLKNRTMKNQWVETMVKINALNMLTAFTSVCFS